MISRHWTGVSRPGQAERYIDHLRRETVPQRAAIPGLVHASILRREVSQGTEFRIVTVGDSLAAIQAFAGADPELAVVPPVVEAMMSTYDRHVVHYDVAESYTR